MLNLFKSKKKDFPTGKIIQLDIRKIRVGEIYEFTNGYHTKTPYYAEVIEAENDYIITSIPHYHQTKISTGNNWEYHRKRMRLIGMYKDFKHLLFNQKNLVTYTRP